MSVRSLKSAYKEFFDGLSDEDRERLIKSGFNPDPEHDLRLDCKDGTLDRSFVTGQFVKESGGKTPLDQMIESEEQPENQSFDRFAVLELVRRILTVHEVFPREREFRLHGKIIAIAVGLPDCPTAKAVADEFGITKQRVSQKVATVAAHLNLPPSFAMDRITPEGLERTRQLLRKSQRAAIARRKKRSDILEDQRASKSCRKSRSRDEQPELFRLDHDEKTSRVFEKR